MTSVMLDDLKQKITQLIAAYEKERTMREYLEAELELSKRMNEDLRKQITELDRQIDNRKLAGAFTNGEDTVGSRQKIDRLIKEIDRCISLMEG